MINQVNLVGRVGGDPEVKYFESGTVKAKLTLAVDKKFKGKDSQPDWFTLEAWGKTAELIANYVRKGKQVAIEGSLKIDTWEDKQTGVERSSPIVKVDQIQFLGSKRDEQSDQSYEDYDYNDPEPVTKTFKPRIVTPTAAPVAEAKPKATKAKTAKSHIADIEAPAQDPTDLDDIPF